MLGHLLRHNEDAMPASRAVTEFASPVRMRPVAGWRPGALVLVLTASVAVAACGEHATSAPEPGADAGKQADVEPGGDLAIAPAPGAVSSADAAAVPADAAGAATGADGGDAEPAAADAPALDAAPDLPPAPAPYPRPQYQRLSETGFYSDPVNKVIAANLVDFHPAHVLWSDAAEKLRHVYLPPGTQVDTSDMDHWRFPVGTKFFKEFVQDGIPVEIRLIERYGNGPDDVWVGAFVWNADGSDAVFALEGAENIRGTQHDAPAAKLCGSCHRGDAGRILGFSALQLSHDEAGLTLSRLQQSGRLSHPPPAGTVYSVPGDATTAAALGYLHANCGHCHNSMGTSWPDTGLVLRLKVGDRAAETSDIWTSVVGKPLDHWHRPSYTTRVVAGMPEMSGLVARTKIRGTNDQMPPLATEVVDPVGVALITAWVTAIPK